MQPANRTPAEIQTAAAAEFAAMRPATKGLASYSVTDRYGDYKRSGCLVMVLCKQPGCQVETCACVYYGAHHGGMNKAAALAIADAIVKLARAAK